MGFDLIESALYVCALCALFMCSSECAKEMIMEDEPFL